MVSIKLRDNIDIPIDNRTKSIVEQDLPIRAENIHDNLYVCDIASAKRHVVLGALF